MKATFIQDCVNPIDKDLFNFYFKKSRMKAGLKLRRLVLNEWNNIVDPSYKLKLKDLTSCWIKVERFNYNGELYCVLIHSAIENFFLIQD